MAYFPLFVDLEGKEILVVGGGRIAERRIFSLLDFGCHVTVVAEQVSEELKTEAEAGRISWIRKKYDADDLLGKPFFVLAAATGEVNETVVKDCRKADIPVNDASKKERCDFYFPGLIKEGDAVIGVTSGGGDHRLAAKLCAGIREFLKEFLSMEP